MVCLPKTGTGKGAGPKSRKSLIVGGTKIGGTPSAKYYEELKSKCNQLAAGLLPAASEFITKEETPQGKLERACYLASASNVTPIGVPSGAFDFREVANIIRRENPPPAVTGNIHEIVQSASNVLYLTDNAGEIGFDSLLIAKLKEMRVRVTLLVKEAPHFEDATLDNASFFQLDKLADNILTVRGFFVPSDSVSPLTDAFRQSELVIAKGTGNYEALRGETKGKVVIYMLKIKCAPIAVSIGASIGQFVVDSCRESGELPQ